MKTNLNKFILNHKKRVLLFIIFTLVSAAFLVLVFGDGGLLTQLRKPIEEEPVLTPPLKRQFSPQAQKFHDEALLKPVFRNKYGDADLGHGPEEKFQVTYVKQSDRFYIHIFDTDNLETIRKKAESHFLNNVLKTNDSSIACELKVVVAIESTLYPLSFCNQELILD